MKYLKKIPYIIFWLICIWATWQLSSAWTGRLLHIPDMYLQPVPHIPQFKTEKAKSWIWKITHTLPATREGTRECTPEWMTQVWTFPSVVYRNNTLEFQVVKADTTYPAMAENIPPNFELHGTPTGYVLFHPRFRNTTKWKKLIIGNEFDYFVGDSTRLLNPYIESQIEVWKLEITAGAKTNKLYIKTELWLW